MGMIEDVIKALERIPVWKRVSTLPDEVKALRERVEALEKRLAPASGDQCPKCRAMAFMLQSSHKHPMLGTLGTMEDCYLCAACGYEDFRTRDA